MTDFNTITGCTCGRQHTCAVESVHIGPGALDKISALLASYNDILLVYDQNTYAACGHSVKQLLSPSHRLGEVLFTQAGFLVPDETSIARIEAAVTPATQVIVGVGSGVINDLCKYTSHQHGLPYMIVVTAPSMDGYASQGAAMILKGMKVTLPAREPRWIIAELDVLCAAPIAMIRAGVGDIIGKVSCLNDWQLSHLINDEYLCPMVYDLMQSQVTRCIDDIPLIIARDPGGIHRLMEHLVMAGIGMSYVGNSRPASGSEHHLAHFYEVVGLLRGFEYFSHGIDVAYGTMVTCALRHALASMHPAQFATQYNRALWEQSIRREYGAAADEVITLQGEVGFYRDNNRLARTLARWDDIRALLSSAPTERQIADILRQIGLDPEAFWRAYTPAVIEESIVYAKDLKDRYTLLWLLQDTGTLETLAAQYVDKYRQPPAYPAMAAERRQA